MKSIKKGILNNCRIRIPYKPLFVSWYQNKKPTKGRMNEHGKK